MVLIEALNFNENIERSQVKQIFCLFLFCV